jgi:hypothetical protein
MVLQRKRCTLKHGVLRSKTLMTDKDSPVTSSRIAENRRHRKHLREHLGRTRSRTVACPRRFAGTRFIPVVQLSSCHHPPETVENVRGRGRRVTGSREMNGNEIAFQKVRPRCLLVSSRNSSQRLSRFSASQSTAELEHQAHHQVPATGFVRWRKTDLSRRLHPGPDA